jgi:hypothetical protein
MQLTQPLRGCDRVDSGEKQVLPPSIDGYQPSISSVRRIRKDDVFESSIRCAISFIAVEIREPYPKNGLDIVQVR